MLRKALFVVAVLALVPTIAKADFKPGDWELTLGGSGASNKGITQGGIGASGSIGYFFSKDLEVSLRQSVAYNHTTGTGDITTASTRVAGDFHFDLGNFRPFVGGNIGYSYGTHGFSDTWEGGPEGGVKYFLNNTTFLFGQVEYQIFFRNGNGPSFNQGSFVYSLGLGVILGR